VAGKNALDYKPVSWKDLLKQAPLWYAVDEATRIANQVILYQRENGGWEKNVDMAATLTLGGKPENPREISDGEWRAARIVGGETFEIKKGDLIVVPRGTPHHRVNAKGKEFSLILIKIFAEPLPAVRAKN
jgi:hypothetical protein